MRIKKVYQGTVPENKILGTYTTSNTDTYSCNYINNCNTYSTSEVNTGKKWIDGKTVYRKVFKFTSLTNSTENQLGTINNVSSVVALYGTANEGGDILSLPHSDFSNLEWNIGLKFSNNKVIVKKGGWGTITDDSFVTIEYTKSS